MIQPYTWSVEGEAYRFLVGLPKQQRRRLARAIERVALHPFQKPFLVERDAEGNLLEVVESEGCVITFHADHAVRRIRITDICSLP